jgi:hypothetical protein
VSLTLVCISSAFLPSFSPNPSPFPLICHDA